MVNISSEVFLNYSGKEGGNPSIFGRSQIFFADISTFNLCHHQSRRKQCEGGLESFDGYDLIAAQEELNRYTDD